MAGKLAVATRKGLFIFGQQQGQWQVVHAALLGDPVTMVHIDARGHLHAAVEHGHFGIKMNRSIDAGKTWEQRPAPKYPRRPDNIEDRDPIRGTDVPWDVKRIWALESRLRANQLEMWCGTIPGGLFYSASGGDDWRLVDSLWNHPERKRWFGGGADFAGLHSIALDPRDADTLRVGVSCGHYLLPVYAL